MAECPPSGKVALRVFLANSFAQAAGFARGMVRFSLLGTAEIDLWARLTLVLPYATAAHGGVYNAAGRLLPAQLAGGRLAEARETERLLLGALLYPALVLAAILLGLAWLRPRAGGDVSWGLTAVAAVLVLQQLLLYFQGLCRAHERFAVLNGAKLHLALPELALTAGLLWAWGLRGLFAAVPAVEALRLAYFACRTGFPLRPAFRPRRLFALCRLGLPIFATGFAFTIFINLDKLMIVAFLGAGTGLGAYTIALFLSSWLNGAATAAGQVLQPRFMRAGESAAEERAAAADLVKNQRAIAVLVPLAAAAAFFGAGPLFGHFGPLRGHLAAHPELLLTIRLLLAGCAFSTLAVAAGNRLIGADRTSGYLGLQAGAIALAGGLNWLFLEAGAGVPGVAAATALTLAAYTVALNAAAWRLADSGRGSGLAAALRLVRPLARGVALLFLFGWALPAPGADLAADLAAATGAGLAFAACYLALSWRADNAALVLRSLAEALRGLGRKTAERQEEA